MSNLRHEKKKQKDRQTRQKCPEKADAKTDHGET
ncbi:hypothetical protein SNOG_12921 [Parastagonospora nodorum SN15]|uniref:Uncharacterized protein n=1 Tax=Phaeosphaeria nodorum (strain SN15 / ATCC MYA-4574 / FGSC 10173) TaxID=321614 RepID=Q0U5P3_PHANO|nr:hypothetical protein SNOG_12921 [Parastagonospora nodorum SN15]EAT79721.1 hypothetical protein SNOG_12921 [Parastagonospora nodorum SN15]